MERAAKVLRYAAFTLMIVVGLFFSLFFVGESFEDPGGWTAVGIAALWVIPIVGLGLFALRRPAAAARLFVALSVAWVLWTLPHAVFIPPHGPPFGPLDVIADYMGLFMIPLAVSLAFLALKRTWLGGLLIVVIALGQFLGALRYEYWYGAEAPLRVLLFDLSSPTMPILVVGLLFLLAGTLEHRHHAGPPRRAAHV